MPLENIATREYYQSQYGNRKPDFYSGILSKILNFSKPGRILDIGAGTGLLTECAMNWGLNCIGIEASNDAIEIARNRRPDIELVLHTLGEPFPFADQSFQSVIMNQVIEHLDLEEAKKALMEAFRVLKVNGLIYILSPCRFNKKERDADPTHTNMLTPTELNKIVKECGFSRLKPMNYSYNYLGANKIAMGITYTFFKIFPWDRLSASANCIAYKP